jgi:hypothetical protein
VPIVKGTKEFQDSEKPKVSGQPRVIFNIQTDSLARVRELQATRRRQAICVYVTPTGNRLQELTTKVTNKVHRKWSVIIFPEKII